MDPGGRYTNLGNDKKIFVYHIHWLLRESEVLPMAVISLRDLNIVVFYYKVILGIHTT